MKRPIHTLGKTIAITLVGLGLLPSVATAHEAGDIILRAGAALVEPDESSSLVSTVQTGALAGTQVGVGTSTQLGLNLVYMFTDSFALEVLAATPFKHDLGVEGLSQYGFSTTDLGETRHLPPTFTATYFFGNADSMVRPYVGVGLNYTTFFDEELSASATSELAASNLEIDDSFGVSWRAGVDWHVSDNWVLNAGVWRIDIEADASFNSALGRVNATVDIDPWVSMISLGYQF